MTCAVNDKKNRLLEDSDEDQRKYETRTLVYRLSLVVNVNLFENLSLKAAFKIRN